MNPYVTKQKNTKPKYNETKICKCRMDLHLAVIK